MPFANLFFHFCRLSFQSADLLLRPCCLVAPVTPCEAYFFIRRYLEDSRVIKYPVSTRHATPAFFSQWPRPPWSSVVSGTKYPVGIYLIFRVKLQEAAPCLTLRRLCYLILHGQHSLHSSPTTPDVLFYHPKIAYSFSLPRASGYHDNFLEELETLLSG